MRRHLLFSALVVAMGCTGDELPPIADFALSDMFIAFDGQGFDGFGQCVRTDEVCNGRDDDCDGVVDEEADVRVQVFSDPENCGACGVVCQGPNATYGCRVGTCVIDTCAAGFIDYNGDPEDGCEADCIITAGGRELCDEIDNDCDGLTDEDYDLLADATHCGACGVVCEGVDNARVTCVEGACAIEQCDENYHDLNGLQSDGCEYACTIRSTSDVTEYCNGLDDDCDGRADEAEDLHAVENSCGIDGACGPDCQGDRSCDDTSTCGAGNICIPRDQSLGDASCEVDADCHRLHPGLACISATTLTADGWQTERRCVPRTHAPMCDGVDGFRCARSPVWQRGNELGFCDGLDNDCDGRADEDFSGALYLPGADQQARPCVAGNGLCQVRGVSECAQDGASVVCSAEPRPPATALDDTCDGVDEDCDGVADEDFQDDMIDLGGFSIYAYEASRPGATAEEAGRDPNPEDGIDAFLEGRACSRVGVEPWADLTWTEARQACEAAGARLCTAEEWALACGGAVSNDFPYGPSFRSQNCNGGVYDVDPAQPSVQSDVLPCGSVERCQRDGVYDQSGNLKEWVSDSIGNLRAVRGGSYDTVLSGGLSCNQDGDWKDRNFRHRTIGFRCCVD